MITALNNESQREGTDLIVRSGSASLTVPKIESATNPGAHTTCEMTLGSTVTLSAVLGAYLDHGAFSGGANVTITCPPAEAAPVAVSPAQETAPAPSVAVAPARAIVVAPNFTG